MNRSLATTPDSCQYLTVPLLGLFSNSLRRVYTNLLSVSFLFKLYSTVDLRKKSIVSASANIVARVELCTSLTNEDAAGRNILTVCSLDSESFRFTIPAVLGATYTFLTCHDLHLPKNVCLHRNTCALRYVKMLVSNVIYRTIESILTFV